MPAPRRLDLILDDVCEFIGLFNDNGARAYHSFWAECLERARLVPA
jgi:hypothetical protein